MAFIPRLFIPSDNIEGSRAVVSGSDFNHVVNVLRKAAGDTVKVFYLSYTLAPLREFYVSERP